VVPPEADADDDGPEASREALGGGADGLLVALKTTMAAMMATTTAAGARAATTRCLERNRFGSATGCSLAGRLEVVRFGDVGLLGVG